jgi:hypothetical protein
MPWYSHSFHRGVALADGDNHFDEGDVVHVVHLPRDDVDREALRASQQQQQQLQQQQQQQQQQTKENEALNCNSNMTENQKCDAMMLRQALNESVTHRDDYAVKTLAHSDTSETFSSPGENFKHIYFFLRTKTISKD